MQKSSLLNDLYSIHAMTGREWTMVAFVREYVSKHIPEAEVRMDRLGNLYISKGESEKGLSPKSLLKESSKHCRYNSNPWN